MTEKLALDENDLYDLYSVLVDATTAASTGNPNDTAKYAAEAKEMVKELHDKAEVVDVGDS